MIVVMVINNPARYDGAFEASIVRMRSATNNNRLHQLGDGL